MEAADMDTDSNCSAMQGLHIQDSSNTIINMDQQNSDRPHLVIKEQPIDKFRFRYKSEMHGTHGSLTGMNTNKRIKTYPTVQLVGFNGDAIIRCSLYQTNAVNKCLHSHILVVRRDNQDCRDPHDIPVSRNGAYIAKFQGMGIIHTAKKFIVEELLRKLIDRKEFLQGRNCTQLEKAKLQVQAESEAKTIVNHLNQVSLCFEAYYMVNNQPVIICESVLSTPINNMKSALTGELKITRLSTTISDAAGNSDLFLFVEKVGKKNIKVRFFEVDENDEVIWEDFGKFSEADVHHQYAIALRTPEYKNMDIEQKVDVFIQLFRPTDNCVSAPVPFQFKPRSTTMTRKRARISSANNSADLPTVLGGHFSFATISKEFNTIGLIDECLHNAMPSEDLEKLIRYTITNSDDMQEIFGCEEIVRDGDAAVSISNDNSVHTICHNIRRVAKKESKASAKAYLEKLYSRAQDRRNPHHRRLDLLHQALIDESGEQPALDVINLYNEFDLAYLFDKNENDEMQTSLHLACIYGKSQCIAKMLQFGANPNEVDSAGNTPLHIAVSECSVHCVHELVNQDNYTRKSHPLQIDIQNDVNMAPLHLAIQKSNLQIVEMIEKAGASLSSRDPKQGNSVLHMAVQQNSEDLVNHLLANPHIDVSQKNTSNYTALDLALCADPMQPNIVNMLMIKEEDNSTNSVHSFCPDSEDSTEIHDSSDSQPTTMTDVYYPSSNHSLFDKTCCDELCNIFNTNDQWLRLGLAFKCHHKLAEWRSMPDPARCVLQYISSQEHYELHHVVNVFLELDVRNALSCLDDMIARRMENTAM